MKRQRATAIAVIFPWIRHIINRRRHCLNYRGLICKPFRNPEDFRGSAASGIALQVMKKVTVVTVRANYTKRLSLEIIYISYIQMPYMSTIWFILMIIFQHRRSNSRMSCAVIKGMPVMASVSQETESRESSAPDPSPEARIRADLVDLLLGCSFSYVKYFLIMWLVL